MKIIFKDADIEGLIANGAPDDEYDSEALEIHDAIRGIPENDLTKERLAKIIQDIWETSFGHEPSKNPPPVYLEIANLLLTTR